MIQLAQSEIDLTIIQNLAYQIWPECYQTILSPHQIQYMLNQFYSLPSLKEQLQRGHHFYHIVEDNEIVGFFSIEYNVTNYGDCKIHKLYIKPGLQKKGLGTSVLSSITSLALEENQARIFLNVNRQNTAISFYIKNGFVIIDKEDIDIGEGFEMNDYVMEKIIK